MADVREIIAREICDHTSKYDFSATRQYWLSAADIILNALSAAGFGIGPVWPEGFPYASRWKIEHDGFVGAVTGYYRRLDGVQGVVLQLDGAKVTHIYNTK